jgi:hypothetical protein
MSYKKVRTVFINDKKKVIYAKPKGTREYVKSGGEMVLLNVYLKRVEKLAAKKAVASKVAKKSKVAKRPKGKMVKGGFFFAENQHPDEQKKISSKQLSTVPPPPTSMDGEKKTVQMDQPPMRMDQPPMRMEQFMQEGGFYRKKGGNSPAYLFNTFNKAAETTVSDLYKLKGVEMQTPVTGGKKRKVKKVNPNPFKKLLNSLSLKKQKRGKKRGGDDGQEYNSDNDMY